jgi:hypothetical protein
MTVQRFGTSSAPCPNGLYVRHSDYAALEAECERLRALETAVRDHRSMYEGTSDEDNMSARSIAEALDKIDEARNTK